MKKRTYSWVQAIWHYRCEDVPSNRIAICSRQKPRRGDGHSGHFEFEYRRHTIPTRLARALQPAHTFLLYERMTVSTVTVRTIMMMMMKMLAFAPLLLTKADSSCGECFRITQNGSGINVMVRPVSTRESVEDFYGYNRDNYSFNGDDVIPLVPNHSLIFLHRNEKDCELSFVIVHDSKKSEDCSGGTVVMYISGDLEDSIVQDGRDSPSDEYTYDEETDETECYWEWNWQGGCKKRTDGIAQLWDTSERECILVKPNFIEGIDAWEFVSGPSGDPENYIPLDLETPLSICAVDC